MTSSILERLMRAKLAMLPKERHTAGRKMWEITSPSPLAREPIPSTGNHPRLTLKASTSIRPSQKLGIETPISAVIIAV